MPPKAPTAAQAAPSPCVQGHSGWLEPLPSRSAPSSSAYSLARRNRCEPVKALTPARPHHAEPARRAALRLKFESLCRRVVDRARHALKSHERTHRYQTAASLGGKLLSKIVGQREYCFAVDLEYLEFLLRIGAKKWSRTAESGCRHEQPNLYTACCRDHSRHPFGCWHAGNNPAMG